MRFRWGVKSIGGIVLISVGCVMVICFVPVWFLGVLAGIALGVLGWLILRHKN